MKFVCCNCGKAIHGPSFIVGKKFMHLECAKEVENKEQEDLESVELEEA